MKKLFEIFLCCALAQLVWLTPLQAQTNTTTGYDIILIAGQSNAVGYGRYETIAVRTDRNVLELGCLPENRHGCSLDDRRLQEAIDKLSHPDPQAVRGFGMSFARAYREQNPNRKVVLVPAAVGSSTLLPYGDAGVPKSPGWRRVVPGSGDTNLYTQAVQMTLKAFAKAEAAAKSDAGGGDVRVAAILWAQGEADIQNVPCDGRGATVCAQPNMDAYKEELKKVVQGFRSDLLSVGGADIPFLAVGQSPTWVSWLEARTEPRWEWYLKWKVLHRAHVDLAEELPAFRRLDTHGRSGQLPSNGEVCAGLRESCTDSKFDRIHYGADALQQLGRELADALVLLNAQRQPAMRLFLSAKQPLVEFTNSVDGKTAALVGVVGWPTEGLDFKDRLGQLTVVLPANTFAGSYTKMAWIKPGDDQGKTGVTSHILSSTTLDQAHFFYYDPPRQQLLAGHTKGTGRDVQAVFSGITGTHWMHVAMVYSANTKSTKLFLNGELVAKNKNDVAALGTPPNGDTNSLVVGGLMSPTERMNGRIYQPRVFGRALSDWQIKQAFRLGEKPSDVVP